MKITFYQAVFNGYDRPSKPKDLPVGCNYVITAGAVDGAVAPIFNRQHKILQPPRIGDVTVYMDGNIEIAKPTRDVAQWACNVLGDADIAICKHAARRCAYVELEACVGRKKITQEQADRAHRALEDAKLPRNFGLWECGIIIRRVNAPWLDAFQAAWFNMLIATDVWRDQLWLPCVLHRYAAEGRVPTGKFQTLQMDVRKNDFFSFKPHA